VRGFLVELGVLLAAFLGATLVAEALGAANTGIAASFGVMAFAVAVVVLLLRRP
jgi:hypothetical protein